MNEPLAALARRADAVDALVDLEAEAQNDAEAAIVRTIGATGEEAIVIIALAVCAFLRETPPWRLAELAMRPEALALAPALMPENVVRFRRK
jgi:hypothetical protein